MPDEQQNTRSHVRRDDLDPEIVRLIEDERGDLTARHDLNHAAMAHPAVKELSAGKLINCAAELFADPRGALPQFRRAFAELTPALESPAAVRVARSQRLRVLGATGWLRS